MRQSFLTLAAIVAGLTGSGPASAKTDPAAWVNRILAEWDEIQAKDGWAPQGEIRPGSLASGSEARLDYPLAAGRSYRAVVVCEPGCGAGEVDLLDPSGSKIGETRALVEMPKLEVAPVAAGTYKLRIAMTDCASETCAWSARLYVKRAGNAQK
ncbi:MAG TPA: hypothetical protein VF535_09705 [Allosphingosinicella sp.]|jgi:hypothetical protein